MTPLPTVTDATFATEVLAADQLVIVDFWADWCGPCRQLAPILTEIATENPQVRLVAVNVDDNPATAAAAQITSIPTLNVYRDGQLVQQIVGAKPKSALLADLAAHLTV